MERQFLRNSPLGHMLLQLCLWSLFLPVVPSALLNPTPGFAQEKEVDEDVQTIDDFWELVPADASIVIGIRNVKRLTERGERLIEQTDYQSPIMLSDAYSMLLGMLRLSKGVDAQGETVLIGKGAVDLEGMIFAVPIEDEAAILANYQLEPADVANGAVVNISEFAERNQIILIRFCTVHLNHLYVSDKREALEGLQQAKAMNQSLTAEIQRTLSDDDILIYLDPKQIDNGNINGLEQWLDQIQSADGFASTTDQTTKDAIARLEEAAREVSFMTVGINLAEGIAGSMMFGFEGERSRQVLSDFAATLPDSSSLQFTQPIAGASLLGRVDYATDSEVGHATAPLLQMFLANGPAGLQQLVPARLNGNLAAVIGQMGLNTQSSRSAMFLNSDSLQHGSNAFLIRIGTSDPAGFVTQLTELASFVELGSLDAEEFAATVDPFNIQTLINELASDDYQVRQAATVKLRLLGNSISDQLREAAKSDDLETSYRAQLVLNQLEESRRVATAAALNEDPWKGLKPKFAFFAAQEQRQGLPVDLIRVQLAGDDTLARPRLEALLGPEWSQFRLIQMPDEVWLFAGSNTQLLDQLLAQRQEAPELSSSHQQFIDRVGEPRLAEVEISLQTIGRLLDTSTDTSSESVVAPAEPNEQTSHFGMTLHPELLRFDFHIPSDEAREVVKRRYLGF